MMAKSQRTYGAVGFRRTKFRPMDALLDGSMGYDALSAFDEAAAMPTSCWAFILPTFHSQPLFFMSVYL